MTIWWVVWTAEAAVRMVGNKMWWLNGDWLNSNKTFDEEMKSMANKMKPKMPQNRETESYDYAADFVRKIC